MGPNFASKWQTSSKSNNLFKAFQVRMQKFGGYLSGMILPLIGVIIAWGFLATFFIKPAFGGATYVPAIGDVIVGPIINFVIPILVGFMAGKLFYGIRGGILGAFVTAGAVWAATWWANSTQGPGQAIFGTAFGSVAGMESAPNMLIAGMIGGSFSAIAFKRLESLWSHKIPAGYELLINNYAFGLFAFAAILFAMFALTPVIMFLMVLLGIITNGIQSFNGLPLLSIIIEPAKPLFLNNAIGNGTLVPIGLQQVQTMGKSILFFAEANPGPGFGMLAAFAVFGSKREKTQAASALPVQFIGGIHEVYFPFVLVNYWLAIPLILSGALGLAVMQIFGAGLNQPMAPGSIIAAYISVNKTGLDYAGISVAIFGSAIASFLGTWLYLRIKKRRGSLDTGAEKLTDLKGRESKYVKTSTPGAKIRLVNVACDQGAGSSALGASTMRKALKNAGIMNINVINTPIKEIRQDADIVIVSTGFKDLASKYKANTSELFVVNNLVGVFNFDDTVNFIKTVNNKKVSPKADARVVVSETPSETVLSFKENELFTNGKTKTPAAAIKKSGALLLLNKFIKKEYIDGMIKRNKDVSVALGNGIAVPHGQLDDKANVLKTGLVMSLYPEGIVWGDKKVFVVIGLAAAGNEHLGKISSIADAFDDPKFAKKLSKAKSAKEVNKLLKDQANKVEK